MSRSTKLWITPHQVVEFTDTKSLSAELATRSRAGDWSAIGAILPDPDPVLRKKGLDMSVYREMLADGRIGACLESRRAGVLALNWEIDRGQAKSRVGRFVQDVFDRLPMRRILDQMLMASWYGMQPMEVVWARNGSNWIPGQVKVKPVKWFAFDEDGELRLRTRENPQGELLPPMKFLLPRRGEEEENPYGERVAARCFWPLAFRKGGMRFWVQFAEKYGSPFLVGRHPRGADVKEIDRLADMLESMVQDAIAVIPDDSSVEFKEAGGKGSSGTLYKQLKDACDEDLAIAILGQNLTTEVQGGSYAAAQTHFAVRADIVDADRAMVQEALQKLIGWLVDLNFGAAARPEFSF